MQNPQLPCEGRTGKGNQVLGTVKVEKQVENKLTLTGVLESNSPDWAYSRYLGSVNILLFAGRKEFMSSLLMTLVHVPRPDTSSKITVFIKFKTYFFKVYSNRTV